MGGTEVLQRCLNLTNNTQNLDFAGWKAFEDSKNRYAIINDYMDSGMKAFRQLQYDYYRKGLDEMANNVERGRTCITDATGTAGDEYTVAPVINGIEGAQSEPMMQLTGYMDSSWKTSPYAYFDIPLQIPPAVWLPALFFL